MLAAGIPKTQGGRSAPSAAALDPQTPTASWESASFWMSNWVRLSNSTTRKWQEPISTCPVKVS